MVGKPALIAAVAQMRNLKQPAAPICSSRSTATENRSKKQSMLAMACKNAFCGNP
jgi:hypothetical protein